MNNLKEVNSDIEKIKKSLKNFGNTFFALGWFSLIISSIFLILLILSNFSFSFRGYGVSDLILIAIEGVLLIVLAGRIKNNVLDKNSRKYVIVILIIYAINTIFRLINLESKGSFVVIFLTIYIITTFISLNKAFKKEEFKEILESPKHKIVKRDWIIFGLISFLLIYCGINFDLNYNKALWADEEFMTNEEFIEESVLGIKEELPLEIDAVTTLIDITGENNIISYYYEISEDYILEDDFIDLIRGSVMEGVCDNEGFEMFFNRGISIKYIYSDYLDNEKFITINSEDCLK